MIGPIETARRVRLVSVSVGEYFIAGIGDDGNVYMYRPWYGQPNPPPPGVAEWVSIGAPQVIEP